MQPIKKKITQRAIAESADVAPDFLNHIINRRRPCPRAVALRLEAATGISKVTWVWGSTEEIKAALAENALHGGKDGHRSPP